MRTEQQGSSSIGARPAWPDVVQKLLRDIDHKRKLAKKKQHLWRHYNEAVKRQTDARKKRDDVLNRIGVHEGPKKVSLERKLSDRNSEVDKSERAVRDSYLKAVKAFRFSYTFQDHLGRLLARLPLSPNFRRYSRELGRLRKGLTPRAWLAETDPTLDAVELRLTELLSLAKNKPAVVAAPSSSNKRGRQKHRARPRYVDKRHQECAFRLETVLKGLRQHGESKEAALRQWLDQHPGLSRTQVTDYVAGRIKRKISKDKRAKIEEAILHSD